LNINDMINISLHAFNPREQLVSISKYPELIVEGDLLTLVL